jgi:hypothetical protein
MKARIVISNGSYGFGKEWTLVVNETYHFYLGQDVKFCSRILGMSPAYIVKEIGSGEIAEPKVNKRLAKFIINQLGLTNKVVKQLNTWELCAQ